MFYRFTGFKRFIDRGSYGARRTFRGLPTTRRKERIDAIENRPAQFSRDPCYGFFDSFNRKGVCRKDSCISIDKEYGSVEHIDEQLKIKPKIVTYFPVTGFADAMIHPFVS